MRRPALLNTTQAAEALGLDTSQVARLARKHGVGFKVGRDWLFAPADLQKLEKRPPVGRPQMR